MQFSPADIAAMLGAFGTTIIIDGAEYSGVFSAPSKLIDQYSGQVITTAPTLLVDETTADLITETITVVTISGIWYVATSRQADISGLVEFELTRDF